MAKVVQREPFVIYSKVLPIMFILLSSNADPSKVRQSNIGSPQIEFHQIFTSYFAVAGKSVESLFKNFQSFIDDCVYHQPSILFLDDLECIAGVAEDQDQSSQVSTYFNRFAQFIHLIVTVIHL